MRLAFKDMCTVSIRAPDDDNTNGFIYRWKDELTRIAVKILPTSFSDSRRQVIFGIAGEVPEKTRIMYYAGIARLYERMGVCVDVPDSAPCDYRIVGVEDWPGHTRAYIAFIPENRRG